MARFKEKTPANMRCGNGQNCPAVLEWEEEYIVVGKKLPPELLNELSGRIGDDEQAIIVPKDLFSELN